MKLKQRASSRGFTLVEMLISVALFMIALTIAMQASIGSQNLVLRSEARASVADSARTVKEMANRITLNVSAQEVDRLVIGGQAVGFYTKQYNQSFNKQVCQAIGRAKTVTSASGESSYAFDPAGEVVAYHIYNIEGRTDCPINDPSLKVFENRLTDPFIRVTEFLLAIQDYPSPACAGCGMNKLVRYRLTLELTSAQAGQTQESRRPTLSVLSSVPVGLLQ